MDLVREGRFRDDLYYRLNVVPIELPALRDRQSDIPLLIDHFIGQLNVAKGRAISGLSAEAARLLLEYEYPGNVRELQNILEHAFVLCRGSLIDLAHLPRTVVGEQAESPTVPANRRRDPLAEAEAREIQAALRRNDGHRSKTAEELGIAPSTLWRKMKRLGIEA
jgi:transcriptional regulator with PAS, ATPase and Fis domain